MRDRRYCSCYVLIKGRNEKRVNCADSDRNFGMIPGSSQTAEPPMTSNQFALAISRSLRPLLLAIGLASIAPCSPAFAQSCSMLDSSINCSDGLSGQRVGSFTYWSDGTTSQRIGNSTYNSDGTSSQTTGNSTYYSDGTSSQRIGNFTYFSDGSHCQRIGNRIICD